MTKLTKKDAATLALGEVSFHPNTPFILLEELAGKQCVFQVRVTPYNFIPNHHTFTEDVFFSVFLNTPVRGGQRMMDVQPKHPTALLATRVIRRGKQ
ncbi:hypothetical protein Bca4012_041366 [Brassica carinata]|uniref:(rape) hypothetical protein n=1 Tax=Brassica napus TaxID=3708 RepID=A0A816IZN2_BRANA|nr:unnamed protein product [Brassica napus]